MIASVERRLTGFQAQTSVIYILLQFIAGEGCLWAQIVQTGHYAPGWNGTLKAGIMAPEPRFYMQSFTLFYNAQKSREVQTDFYLWSFE